MKNKKKNNNNNSNREITVSNAEALKNAAHAKYAKIIVSGSYATEVGAKVRKAQTGDTASDVALFVGLFFWPAFLGGIAGKILTHDLKAYNMDVQSDTLIVLTRK